VRHAADGGKMNFAQFTEIFLPFDQQHATEIANRQPTSNKVNAFKEQTQQVLVDLIALLVKSELKLKLLHREAHAK